MKCNGCRYTEFSAIGQHLVCRLLLETKNGVHFVLYANSYIGRQCPGGYFNLNYPISRNQSATSRADGFCYWVSNRFANRRNGSRQAGYNAARRTAAAGNIGFFATMNQQ